MTRTQPDAVATDRSPRLLFVHSGSTKKRLTFEAAARMGLRIYLLNPTPNWATDYAERALYSQGKSLASTVAAVQRLHDEVQLDGVVTFWEEDVPTAALLSRRLRLPGSRLNAAFNARSKYRMRLALQRAGVPVPPFCRIDSPDSLRLAAEQIAFPAILKPEWGSDSEWVARVESLAHAAEVFGGLRRRVRVQDCIYPYRGRRFVLEGLLSGPEVSVEGVVQEGRVTLYAIIDKAQMDEDSFIERGECTPSRFPEATQAAIRKMVIDGVRALGLTNSGIHAEVKITPDGPRIVEIGARMGGDCIHALVLRVYGTDLAEQNIRVALGQPAAAAAPPSGCALSTTLVPEQPGRVLVPSHIPVRRSPHLIEVVLTKQTGDVVAVPPDGYDNLAWISVWGRTHAEAQRRLEQRTARLGSGLRVEPLGQDAVGRAALAVA
jgi:biotin carboxylase